jgi:hypothetical protein
LAFSFSFLSYFPSSFAVLFRLSNLFFNYISVTASVV